MGSSCSGTFGNNVETCEIPNFEENPPTNNTNQSPIPTPTLVSIPGYIGVSIISIFMIILLVIIVLETQISILVYSISIVIGIFSFFSKIYIIRSSFFLAYSITSELLEKTLNFSFS